MYDLFTPIVSSGSLSNQGIQNFNVFYDTLFMNIKTMDDIDGEFFNYVIIEKLNFDYTDVTFNSDNKNYLINFGDTNSHSPFVSNTGNTFIDNILLEKEKTVFICGLSAAGISATSVGSEAYSGTIFYPVVYKYDINKNDIKIAYPLQENIIWNNIVLGDIVSVQPPLVSYNNETQILNLVFKTTISTHGNTVDCLNDIELKYNKTNFNLNNIRTLTSNVAIVNDIASFRFVKLKNYNDNEKLLLGYTNNNAIVPIKI